MKRVVISVLVAAAAAFVFAPQAVAQVAVIANTDVPASSIDAAKLINLFTLQSNEIGGAKIKLFDMTSDSPAKTRFYGVLGKPVEEMRKIWLKAKLTGNGNPPTPVPSEDEMIAKVSSTPGAVGYVSAGKVTGKVKTLLTLE
jgi:ABC-type phosphate transport system substrate-binding protein